MTDMPRIAKIEAKWPVLFLTLKDGWKGVADLTGWIATGGELLEPLRDPELFSAAKVAEYGTAVAWNDEDLMIDAVHLQMLAKEQSPFTGELIAKWQRELDLSNAEAADFLGLSASTFNAYKAGSNIPTSVAIACRAAMRDPLLMQAHYRPRKTGRPKKEAAAG